MILKSNSYAYFLSDKNSRSRMDLHIYLTNNEESPTITPNPGIHNQSTIILNVVISVTEAEYSAVFKTTQSVIPIRDTLTALGHPQPATPPITKNTVAYGLSTNNYKPFKMRAANMCYHYLQDKITDNTINIQWKPGKHNKDDYFTKHFNPNHHKTHLKYYVTNTFT